MTPAKIAIQEATLTRLQNNLSVTVGTDWQEGDTSLPFIEIGDDDEVAVRETTASVHTDVPHTIRNLAYTEKRAKELGRDAAKELTDRTSKLSLSAPFHLLRSELIGLDMQRTRRVEGRDIFTDILIVQHRISRS